MMERRSRAARICYFIFVLILAGAMAYGLKYIWDGCREYQESCAATLLETAEKQASKTSGLDLKCSPVPKVEDNGDISYAIKNGREKVGNVKLRVKKQGLLTIALYEIKSIEGCKSYSFSAPEGVRAEAAGRVLEPVSKEAFFGSDTLSGLSEDKIPPRLCRYTAENIFDISQVSITSPASEEIVVITQKDGTGMAVQHYPENVSKALKDRSFEIAGLYSKYISKDAAWATLSKQIMDGSPLKKSIPSLDRSWYTVHTSVKFRNKMISEPVMLSENYALTYLSYDYVVLRGKKENIVPTELAMYLHKDKDGVWRMAEMNTYLYYDIPMAQYE